MPPRDAKVVNIEDARWKADLEFVLKPNGKVDATSLHNVKMFLMHHPHLRDMFWYDEFVDEIFMRRPVDHNDDSSAFPRPLQDHDETELAMWLNENGLAPSIRNTGSAIRTVAFKNKRNPIVEWAESLKWDGQKRIDTWLTYYAGAASDDYTKMVGRRFLISAMARILEPGCKVDTMLILEGPQGLKKSSLIDVLAGPGWFSDQIGDITNKDSSQLVQGIWLMEVAEMDKFGKPEASAVKAFLTRRFDRYRPPYGRNVVKRERRCVFFGTINPDGAGYLKDTTGNRRYWPVKVTNIDLDGIRQDRNQIWAEAMLAYRCGERWWVENDDDEAGSIAEQQDARREDDVWEPKVWEYLTNLNPLSPYFTPSDVLKDALAVSIDKQTQSHKNRLSKILRGFGCEDYNNTNGIKGRHWGFKK